jgi:alkylation response protein AidB-like acyl-CoA dehydrogenase
MPFSAEPLFPGDIHDSAYRLGLDFSRQRGIDATDPLDVAARICRQAVELGWPALLIPEPSGGAGGELADLAAIAEGGGRSGLPLSLASLCIGPQRLLMAASAQPLACTTIAALAAGEILCAVVRADQSIRDKPDAFTIDTDRENSVLNGIVFGIDGAAPPSDMNHPPVKWLLVLPAASGGDARQLILLSADTQGLTERRYVRIDGRAALDLHFTNVIVQSQSVLLSGVELDRVLEENGRAEIAVAAAASIGAMGALIEATIEYLNTRKQFGVALSSFQALRHQLAGIYVDYENTRAQVQSAFIRADGGIPSCLTASLLQLSLARIGRKVGEIAIQLHGGMGMTEELPAARLAKRLMLNAFENGGVAMHVERAARFVFADSESIGVSGS